MAAVDGDELAIVLVHRGSGIGDIETRLDLDELAADGDADVTTLTDDSLASENTLEEPENVAPEHETAVVADGDLSLTVPEYGLVRVVVPR